MNRNLTGLLIGLVGAGFTVGAYSQTMMSTTQCLTVGLLILVLGLVVKEGFLSL